METYECILKNLIGTEIGGRTGDVRNDGMQDL